MNLITGATGMTGAELAAQLISAGTTTIHATKRTSSSLELLKKVFASHFDDPETALNRIVWHTGSLLDSKFVENVVSTCDKIYHVAAMVSYETSRFNEVITNNVESTKNIVNACLQHQNSKLLYVSSIAALGRANHKGFVDETCHAEEKNCSTGYSISKLRAEKEVWKGVEKGLNAVIVNPAIILGNGEWEKGSAALVNTIWKGLYFYTTGSNGFVDVKDVARAANLLMESKITKERFVLNGTNLSYKAIFTLIAHELDKKAPSIKATPLMTEMAWRFAYLGQKITGKQAVLTKESCRTAMSNYAYSSEKIEHHLNFSFTPIEKTVKDICNQLLLDKEMKKS